MLLDETTSKEQVEAALAAGDDELREDIEEILDDVKRRWDRGPGYDEDYYPIDMKDIVARDDFRRCGDLREPVSVRTLADPSRRGRGRPGGRREVLPRRRRAREQAQDESTQIE